MKLKSEGIEEEERKRKIFQMWRLACTKTLRHGEFKELKGGQSAYCLQKGGNSRKSKMASQILLMVFAFDFKRNREPGFLSKIVTYSYFHFVFILKRKTKKYFKSFVIYSLDVLEFSF